MVETAIVKREQGLAALSPQEVRTLLPVGKATDTEIGVFIRYCQAVQADPWAKEIYLVKYDERAVAAIVLALNWYLKRASHNPAYESYESGVIVKRQGEYIDVVGSVVYEGDTLFGGWCKCYKKGVQRPFERRVTMAEYDKHQFGWKTMPATMIEKVAIVQGIRRAFPDEFTGFQDKAELPVVLEGEVEEVRPPRELPADAPERAERHTSEEWSAILAHTKEALDAISEGKEGPPVEAEPPSKVTGVTKEMETPPKATFEVRKKAMMELAIRQYGFGNWDMVANAANYASADDITTDAALEKAWRDIMALYGKV